VKTINSSETVGIILHTIFIETRDKKKTFEGNFFNYIHWNSDEKKNCEDKIIYNIAKICARGYLLKLVSNSSN